MKFGIIFGGFFVVFVQIIQQFRLTIGRIKREHNITTLIQHPHFDFIKDLEWRLLIHPGKLPLKTHKALNVLCERHEVEAGSSTRGMFD